MRNVVETAGFAPPAERPLGRERRRAAFAELIATVGLAACTVVAATAVSIGIARASAVTGVIDQEGSLFGLALLLGLIFIGLGGLSVLPPGSRTGSRR